MDYAKWVCPECGRDYYAHCYDGFEGAQCECGEMMDGLAAYDVWAADLSDDVRVLDSIF